MLAFLGPRATARKGRLYLCGGCRQVWDLLYDDASRTAVEVGERFVDGEATLKDLKDADYDSEPSAWMLFLDTPSLRLLGPNQELPPGIRRLIEMGILTEAEYRSGAPEIGPTDDPDNLNWVRTACALANMCVWSSINFEAAWSQNLKDRTKHVGWPDGDIIRDLFGDPFRPVAFDLRWRTTDAIGLARAIYDDRAFDRLPILADALMDAGCDDEDILAHCRTDGPHVRGCWVVDLVLGKE